MNKKIFYIIGALILVVVLFFVFNPWEKKDPGKAVGLIHLEMEDLPANVRDYLDQHKMSENYLAFKYDEETYLFASRGEVMTEGYKIVLKDALYFADKLQVTVEKRDPGKDEMVAQVLSYPVKLVKLADNTLQYSKVEFLDTEGKVLNNVDVIEISKVPETLVDLYFGTADGYFKKEQRIVSAEISTDNAYLLIEELLKGTVNPQDTLNVLPEGTTILNYSYDADKKIAIIDLGGTIKEAKGSMGEIFAVYSVVNTLTQVDGIEKVKILINGEEVESLSGHIYLKDALSPDYSLLEDNKYK